MDQSQQTEKFYGLDALRGVLAIIVCIAHSLQIFIRPFEQQGPSIWYQTFALAARFAVLWFFCLSGYVIALSVKKNIGRHGGFSLADYSMSRLVRVMPSLLFAIALAVVLVKISTLLGINSLPSGITGARPRYEILLESQLTSLFSIGAFGELTGRLNGPLWSLQFELQFYTVIGLGSFVLFSSTSLWRRLFAVICLALYWQHVFHVRTVWGTIAVNTLWYGTFLCGVLAFVFFRNTRKTVLIIVAIASFFYCLYVFSQYTGGSIIWNLDKSLILMWAQMALAVTCTALIILISRTKVSRRLGDLGKFGYTLYIIHFPILLFVYFYLVNSIGYTVKLGWLAAVLSPVFCVLFAKFISRWVEDTKTQRAIMTKILNGFFKKLRFFRSMT